MPGDEFQSAPFHPSVVERRGPHHGHICSASDKPVPSSAAARHWLGQRSGRNHVVRFDVLILVISGTKFIGPWVVEGLSESATTLLNQRRGLDRLIPVGERHFRRAVRECRALSSRTESSRDWEYADHRQAGEHDWFDSSPIAPGRITELLRTCGMTRRSTEQRDTTLSGPMFREHIDRAERATRLTVRNRALVCQHRTPGILGVASVRWSCTWLAAPLLARRMLDKA